MIRNLAGLAAGLAVAIVTIMVVEAIGHQLFPPPGDADLTQPMSASLPFGTLIFPVIAWFLGALAGSWLALWLCAARWAGWAIAAFVLAGTIANFALISHPLWVIIAGLVAPILGGWLAHQLPAGRRNSAG